MPQDLIAIAGLAGALSKPAELLIEKVSGAIGAVYEPTRIRRKAEAEGYALEVAAESEAKADLIRASAKIEVGVLEERALTRMLAEQVKKQVNIESVTAKALPLLEETANPSEMDDDWITHFFESGRNISDSDMQLLWARVLAGEANRPGAVAKRAVSLLATLSKEEAELFTSLCRFCETDGPRALVYEFRGEGAAIYAEHGLTFDSLLHLESIGLINFSGVNEYYIDTEVEYAVVRYFDHLTRIRLTSENNRRFPLGFVMLTKAGEQLAPATRAEKVEGFYPYLLKRWAELGLDPTPLYRQ